MKKHLFILILALTFTAVFGGLSVVFLYGVWRQSGTTGWPSVQGEVLESRVVSQRGSKGGRTYRPEISYRYSVGGTAHESSSITLGAEFSDSGGGYARRMTTEYPAGKVAPVYYNPAAPEESVLVRGVTDRDWQMISLLGVFVSVPAALWVVVIASFRSRSAGRVGTVRVLEPAPGVAVVRSVVIGPWIFAAIFWFVGQVATVLVTMIAFDTHARESVLAGWAGSAVLAGAMGLWRLRWMAAGRCDHVIDRASSPPAVIFARGVRKAADAVPLARVKGTELKQDSNTSTNNHRHWRVHLVVEGEEKTRPLVDIRLKQDAEEFEGWLRERLGLGGA